ncbi:hypothetical protein MIND_01175600 [Mycena indigotica]|uniref:Uncharacterized protein n=1 Tax=Mycena indigotica TaxID=2126181 RepID=A0A8H6S5U3_9AGAR|nr:uncharacterized protein MIND_01175600 [Mycena indigotica]KAF7292770.1 hypothetical protein MIND_01175600 [Mycena indigotica]
MEAVGQPTEAILSRHGNSRGRVALSSPPPCHLPAERSFDALCVTPLHSLHAQLLQIHSLPSAVISRWAKLSSLRAYPSPPTHTIPLVAPVSRLPTHLLAVVPSPNDRRTPTLLIPVDANLFHEVFDNTTFIPQLPPDTPPPSPTFNPATEAFTATVPVLPVVVPHAPSLALLLLFGLGLETDRNMLAAHLLPAEAIAEFPNAAAMSGVVSRLPTTQFDFYWEMNQGLWRNTLALAARNAHLTELVPITLKVVADARKLRIRRW